MLYNYYTTTTISIHRTLLHFACKSGAIGIGDAEKSLNLVVTMVEKHQANPNLICKWNDMSALHIATYFDVAPVVGYLVTVVKPSIIDYPSRYLDSQTPLHIAATNLCLRSARILLSSGANILLKDDRMKTPLDCVPIEMNENSSIEMNQPDISLELRTILEEATLIISGESNSTDAECMKTAKVVLSALGLEIGDRIIVGNAKVGTLRYCGMYSIIIIINLPPISTHYRTHTICNGNLDRHPTRRAHRQK